MSQRRIAVIDIEPYNRELIPFFQNYIARHPQSEFTLQQALVGWYYYVMSSTDLALFTTEFRDYCKELTSNRDLDHLIAAEPLQDVYHRAYRELLPIFKNERLMLGECSRMLVLRTKLFMDYPVEGSTCARHTAHLEHDTEFPGYSEHVGGFTRVPEDHARAVRKRYIHNGRGGGVQSPLLDGKMQPSGGSVTANSAFLDALQSSVARLCELDALRLSAMHREGRDSFGEDLGPDNG